MAIEHADTVLQWQENVMDKSEMPPQWMWPFPKELDGWWAQIDADRKAHSKGEEPEGPMVPNELAKHW